MTTWREGVLSDLAVFQRGFDITKAEQRDGPYPVVSSSGIASYHDTFKVDGPGVVIGRKGTLGTVHYVDGPFWPHDTSLWVKDFRGNHPRFVAYFVRTLHFEQYNVGGANPTLNRNHIHRLPIRFPEIREQERIADVLSAYDDLIAANARRMALLEESVHLLYREWFQRLRFPGHEWTAVENGLPEGWRATSLSNVAHVNPGTVDVRHAPPTIEYVDISSLGRGRINASTEFAWPEAPSRARRLATDGDVLWSMVRPANRAYAIVDTPPDNLVVSTGIAVLSPRAVPTSYLYAATATDAFVDHIASVATGASYPAAKPGDFEAAPFVLPSANILESFDAYAAPRFRMMASLHRQNAKLRDARDLLLPRLLSGRLTA